MVWLWVVVVVRTRSAEEALCWRHCRVFRDWIPFGLHLLGSQVKPTASWSREGKCHLSIPVVLGSTNHEIFCPLLRHSGKPVHSWVLFELSGRLSPWPTSRVHLAHNAIPPQVTCCWQDRANAPWTVYKWAGATRATQGGPLSRSPGVWAGSPGLSAAGPSALLRQSGGRSLSSGDSGRACTCKCALQAQPAGPEWPLSCSREVVEREPGRGRQQENTGHQLRQGRFCFPRTIFTSGDGLEKWHRDLWGAVMWIPSLRGGKSFFSNSFHKEAKLFSNSRGEEISLTIWTVIIMIITLYRINLNSV